MDNTLAVANREVRRTSRKMTPQQRKRRIRQIRMQALRCIWVELMLGIRALPNKTYRFVLDMMAKFIVLALLSAGVMLAMGVFFAALTFWMNIPI